jgi:hypothetical protein
MAFSDSLKLIVKKKAHFKCCLCQSLNIEIHHIIPQEENGEDTEDNAAPLCPSCHEIFGSNPSKRKMIREARDFWYEACESLLKPNDSAINELKQMIRSIPSKEDLQKIKDDIIGNIGQQITKNNVNHKYGKQLSLEELLTHLLNVNTSRDYSQYGFLTIEPIWEKFDEDSLWLFNKFKERFGIIILHKLAIKTLDECKVPVYFAISEDELSRATSSCFIEMFTMLLMSDGRVTAWLGQDDKIRWQALPGRLDDLTQESIKKI